MRCQGCDRDYKTYPGILYFDVWFKSNCPICKKEGSVCSFACKENNICKSCRKSINLEKVLEKILK